MSKEFARACVVAACFVLSSSGAQAEPTKYPTVTQMEVQVFHKTFENESIQKRLDNLETKVFGSSSAETETDMAERVDDLTVKVSPGTQAPSLEGSTNGTMTQSGGDSFASGPAGDSFASHKPAMGDVFASSSPLNRRRIRIPLYKKDRNGHKIRIGWKRGWKYDPIEDWGQGVQYNTASQDVFVSGSAPENWLSDDEISSAREARLHHPDDVFAQYTDEVDWWKNPEYAERFTAYRPNDPFSSRLPEPEAKCHCGHGTAQAPTLQGATNGTIGPQGDDGMPHLQGATNGTIGPQGWRHRRIAWRGLPYGLQGRTNGTIGPPLLQGWTNGTIGPQGEDPPAKVRPKRPRPAGPRWADNRLPLKVYISGTVEDARNGLVSNEIKSALKQWADASDGSLKYVITRRFTEADILFAAHETSEGQWAETSTDIHKGMYDRVRVDFLLKTLHQLPAPRLKGICLHEIGHALGIVKHSGQVNDVMAKQTTDDFPTVLTSNDKQLISSLYQ